MHKVARFCRNKKRHEPRAGNGQYFFFFFAGKLWGYNGSHAARGGVSFEDDELHSYRNAVCMANKPLLCSPVQFWATHLQQNTDLLEKNPAERSKNDPKFRKHHLGRNWIVSV